MSRVISVRVSDAIFESIESLSKRLKKSRSEVVLEAIVKGLKILSAELERIQKIEELIDIIERKKIRIRGNVSIVDIVSRERE